MYIHIEVNADGQSVGGWISDPQKDPDSSIVGLIETLSEGLNSALKVGES